MATILACSSAIALAYNVVHSMIIQRISSTGSAVLGEIKVLALLVASALLFGEVLASVRMCVCCVFRASAEPVVGHRPCVHVAVCLLHPCCHWGPMRPCLRRGKAHAAKPLLHRLGQDWCATPPVTCSCCQAYAV